MIVLSLFRGLIDSAPSMKTIAERTAAEFGLEAAELKLLGKANYVIWPRQIAMTRMYDTGRFSNTQIARFFGLKNHTTVIHARRTVAEFYRVAA